MTKDWKEKGIRIYTPDKAVLKASKKEFSAGKYRYSVTAPLPDK